MRAAGVAGQRFCCASGNRKCCQQRRICSSSFFYDQRHVQQAAHIASMMNKRIPSACMAPAAPAGEPEVADSTQGMVAAALRRLSDNHSIALCCQLRDGAGHPCGEQECVVQPLCRAGPAQLSSQGNVTLARAPGGAAGRAGALSCESCLPAVAPVSPGGEILPGRSLEAPGAHSTIAAASGGRGQQLPPAPALPPPSPPSRAPSLDAPLPPFHAKQGALPSTSAPRSIRRCECGHEEQQQ